ncbi:MAG: hypothetical protein WC849_02610 [Candidatus Paceibacterota bacterium]
MKKLFTKKQIISAFKITFLSAILIVGLNYANAAWSGPTATAPDGNTPSPINIGTSSQIKNGGLGVNALSVFGNGLFTGKATAQRFCFANGVCISSWPEACAITQASQPVVPTVTLIANPTSVEYNGQSTLTWSSTNTISCSANWTSLTATGGSQLKSNLTSTTTYTITCTGAGGSAQGSTTVTVGSAPPPPPPACTKQQWCRDTDGDGYTASSSVWECNQPSGYSSCSSAIDCNDNNSNVWRTVNGYVDMDKDGYGTGQLKTCVGNNYSYVSGNTDCNDTDVRVNPGATWGIPAGNDGSWDLNCNGVIEKKWTDQLYAIGNDFKLYDNYPTYKLTNTPTGISCILGSPITGLYATSYTMTDLSSYACGQAISPSSVTSTQIFVDSSCSNRFYTRGNIYEMPCK